MIATSYNPDVLSCLANLSNDEVFTPPNVVNDMLDLLPAELWSNPKATFLDPVSKTGVFLREIAKRLMAGLADQIPDEQERANHIFNNQIYGIAITELTGLLSRRSVYCSKRANHEKYSLCDDFNDEQGNIRYERLNHTWDNGKCIYCGGSEEVYGREDELETYAYNFIHIENPLSLFNTIENTMKFDVIVGNPPYQLNDGGGTGSSAKPIYHLFIQQAQKLKPRYLTMIVPARWFSGGKGLDEFRSKMIQDKSIRKLVDYADSRDCFPGVDISGGVCYFLWDRDNPGVCDVETVRKGKVTYSTRLLDEFESFVRDNQAVDIINKVKSRSKDFLDTIVSSRMPFGLTSSVRPEKKGEYNLISSGGNGKIGKEKITSGHHLIDKWKVLLSKASNDHGGQPDKEGRRKIFSRIEVMEPGTVCTESYLVVGSYDTELEAKNMKLFLSTKFCKFLVGALLLTQNITKSKFAFVPSLPMDRKWEDEDLYQYYKLDNEEIAFIEELIR